MNRLTLLQLVVFSAFSLSFINFQANSQELTDSTNVKNTVQSDSLIEIKSDTIPGTVPDTTKLQPTDSVSISVSDSLLIMPTDTSAIAQKDSVKKPPVGDIKTTVHYVAQDSITLNMRTHKVKIYGDGKIDYKPIALDAQEIDINWEENYMQAHGVADSTGKVIGKPVFKNGNEVYETNEIKYNFKTEKASITGLVTTQGDAYIHADKVFKDAQGDLYNRTTLYTTCNLAHPHYSIKATRVKVIPNKEMISGPFFMTVHDVPTPLGFAFGMFPDQQNRTSGVIFPDFGEETRRGFYLKNGGYYFAFNDYINLDLTGDIYTKGGWAVRAASQYYVRYKFRGSFSANFTRLKQENEATLQDNISNDFRLTWSHTPETKGTGRFSANVNYQTATYNVNNQLYSVEEQTQATASSSISYSKTFSGTPFSLGISGRFNQNLRTKQSDMQLPDITFNVQNIYPFKGKASSGNKWYEKINFRYSMTATNKISNKLSIPITNDEGQLTYQDSTFAINGETIGYLISQGSNGVKHNIPVSASFKALKYFTISPSFSYNELWYSKKLNYSYNETTEKIETDTIKGFNAIRYYNFGASINTRVYGTVVFKREYGVQAIRHMMTPSVSYSYTPNFGDEKYDYYQTVQSDSEGNTTQLSRYNGFVYGTGAGTSESSSISLSITNTLEMKYKSRKDTTGKAEKIAILRNFGVGANYDFLREKNKLSNISVRATTDLLKNKELGSIKTTGLSLNFTGTINPYVYRIDSIVWDEKTQAEKIYQTKYDQYAWNNGQGLGQLSKINVSLNTGFQAQDRKNGGSSRNGSSRSLSQGVDNIQTNSFKEEAELNEYINDPNLYVDFNIPWSFRFSYNLGFSKEGFIKDKVTQSLTFNGDISLTEKWKVTFNSGYDFKSKKFNQTKISIIRDLHCWDMTLNWVPSGRFQSYNFTIKAKSSLLQDLKLSKKRNASDSFGF
ncbi:MAG: LPS-assembly protein LptD [Cyclobacteriaceae bacterium]|nr:LPS-assembly protein LptD [Cyclobacteriaceae bacterium]